MIIHNTYVQSPTFLSSLIHYMYVLYIHSYPHLFNPIIFFHLSWFIFMYHPELSSAGHRDDVWSRWRERNMWCVRPNGSSWERSRNLGLMMRLLLCLHWHTQVSWGRDSGESEHYYGVTAKHYVCQNKLGGIFCQFFKLTKILIFYTSLACVPWSLTRLIAILVTDYVKPTVTSM